MDIREITTTTDWSTPEARRFLDSTRERLTPLARAHHRDPREARTEAWVIWMSASEPMSSHTDPWAWTAVSIRRAWGWQDRLDDATGVYDRTTYDTPVMDRAEVWDHCVMYGAPAAGQDDVSADPRIPHVTEALDDAEAALVDAGVPARAAASAVAGVVQAAIGYKPRIRTTDIARVRDRVRYHRPAIAADAGVTEAHVTSIARRLLGTPKKPGVLLGLGEAAR